MALVVPWHAGIFFAFRGQGGMPLMGGLWLSHAFRMPLFFLLAGFLGATAVGRHGGSAWLRGRGVRLGIPLLVGVILLAPLEGTFDAWVGKPGTSAAPSLAGLTHPRPEHLWFLWYLLVISGAWLAARAAIRGIGGAGRPLGIGESSWPIALLPLPCALAIWSMGGWEAAPSNSFAAPAGLLAYYAIFFAVGWLLGNRASGLEILAANPWRRLAAALVVAIPAFWLFAHAHDQGIADSPWIRFAALYLSALCCWLMISGLIGACRRLLARERSTVRYAADASYWIYLSHMLFLAPLQLLLVGWLPGLAQFTVAVLATFALTLLTYELFVRYSAIGQVLHGPRLRARRPRVAAQRGRLAQMPG
jgi:glucan biosynthesis protein C